MNGGNQKLILVIHQPATIAGVFLAASRIFAGFNLNTHHLVCTVESFFIFLRCDLNSEIYRGPVTHCAGSKHSKFSSGMSMQALKSALVIGQHPVIIY